MPGSFSPSFSTLATTKQNRNHHHKSSSSSSPSSSHSDSALLHISTNNVRQQQNNQQRPVSVPPAIFPVLAELDERLVTNFTSEMGAEDKKSSTSVTPTMSALLGRQPTINEDEDEADLTMTGTNGAARRRAVEEEESPDFGVATVVSGFGIKKEPPEEIIMLEEDGQKRYALSHRKSSLSATRFVGKAMDDECREGVAQGIHSTQLKREEDDAMGAEQRQRDEDAAELGADAAARLAARQRKREPVVVGWRTLERTMRATSDDNSGGMSPLEQYLLGTTLLARLCSFFEMAFAEALRPQRQAHPDQRGKFKFNLPIKEYEVGADGVMSATFPSYPMPISPPLSSAVPSALGSPGDHSSGHQQLSALCMVRLQLLVCPQEFRLIAKLNYTGIQCPAESDVRVFERFFARSVVQLNNEMAVFTFVTLCRLCYPPMFASFAQLMMAQMEPQPRWPWRADLELVHIQTDELSQQQPAGPGGQTTATGTGTNFQQQQQQKIQKIVKNSVVVPDMCKRFLFIISLKPRGPNAANYQPPQHQYGGKRAQQQTNSDRHLLTMHYDVDLDELTLHKPDQQQYQKMSSEEIQAIENVLKTELCRQSVVDPSKQQHRVLRSCCIWPCIRALLEGHHHQQQQVPLMSLGLQQIQGVL
uniref:UDENN domain-containing protein n=1 Tax=Globodera pallida TaxID=36090 RepID=A0A183CH71_GLOPA